LPANSHIFNSEDVPPPPGVEDAPFFGFVLQTSDLGQKIPDRNNDDVHIFLETSWIKHKAKIQQPPRRVVRDATQSGPQDIAGMDYLGSDRLRDYFLSHSDHKYFYCNKVTSPGLNPLCNIRYNFEDNFTIYFWVSRAHIADLPLIVKGVTTFLADAKLNMNDFQRAK
jgi:hypothetical protein